MIAFIKESFDFQIGCSFYPEKHPEAESLERDIEVLKLKQDNGADFAVSQIFFDNAAFYQFQDKAAQPGRHPPPRRRHPARDLARPTRPRRHLPALRHRRPPVAARLPRHRRRQGIVDRGVDYAVRQCRDLLEHGVAGIHFYTLNRSTSSLRVTEALRADGYFAKSRAECSYPGGRQALTPAGKPPTPLLIARVRNRRRFRFCPRTQTFALRSR